VPEMSLILVSNRRMENLVPQQIQVLPHLLAVLHRGAEGLLDKNVVWFAVGDDVHEYLVVCHVRRRHDYGIAEPAVQQLPVV
jgi:hypothetical protein